jgi:DNA (cytosine-5)-methyltransferase 1
MTGISLVQQMNTPHRWPTPLANSHTGAGHGPNKTGAPNLQTMVSMWPTPTVCGNHNRKGASAKSGDGLATAVAKWPTPTAQDAKNNGSASQMNRNSLPLNAAVGGQLSPDWTEWLMGWPIGHTDLKPLETDRFQQWRQQHGVC